MAFDWSGKCALAVSPLSPRQTLVVRSPDTRRRIVSPTRHHPKAHWKLLFFAAAAAQAKSQLRSRRPDATNQRTPENVSKPSRERLDGAKIV